MSKCNYVYVIRFGDIDHKVGFSVSPTRRIAEVKGQSVVRVWRRPNGDAQALEGIAHRLLREWRIPLPSEKERFSVSADVACEAIEIAARNVAVNANRGNDGVSAVPGCVIDDLREALRG